MRSDPAPAGGNLLRIDTKAVESVATRILRNRGTPDDIAADVAAHLTLADRSGHASHGLSILPNYVSAIAAGLLAPAARPTVSRDDGTFLSFDAHSGFGQHAGKFAVERAIESVRRSGSCFLTINGSYHLGRAGHFGEMAAQAGFVYLSFINVVGLPPMVAPYGGSEARLSTNPLCLASPIAPGHPPFLLDYATSGIAANKVRLMAANGDPVPAGMLIDSAGQPTSDAAAFLGDPPGALLPFGRHKGYALGFFAELMAGVLSGGGTIAPGHARDGGLRNNLFAIMFDPLRLGDGPWQQEEAAAFSDYVTSCPAATPGQKVMVPGQPEAQAEAKTSDTIEMSASAWALFEDCARASGIETDTCHHAKES